MFKKLIITLFTVFIWFHSVSQDTIRVMVSNLLYYGQHTGFCNEHNNHPDDKDSYLRIILQHDLPDLFVVNEMSRNSYYHQRIIDSVFARISDRVYARALSEYISNSNIMNMMYYNTSRLVLHSQHIIASIVRDINLYTLYYKSPDLLNGDTAFINCIAVHLKAGSTVSDEQTRRNQINDVTAWLKINSKSGNFLIMGDFNFYTVDELAMQALLFNPDFDFRFYDPVDQLGNWHENPFFASYHTQSTHRNSGCHVGGGLDDRFDFILASIDVLEGNNMVQYVEDSYRTMGQDGLHFNKALTDPPENATVPPDVLMALYNNSDHLPVLLSLAIDQTPVESGIPEVADAGFIFNNPVKDELKIRFRNPNINTPYILNIYSLHGKLLISENGVANGQPLSIKVNHLPAGYYLAELYMHPYRKSMKIIKY